jgi:hypothetical protein
MVLGLGALGWTTPSFAPGELGGCLGRLEHGVHGASERQLDFYFLIIFFKKVLRMNFLSQFFIMAFFLSQIAAFVFSRDEFPLPFSNDQKKNRARKFLKNKFQMLSH